MIIPCINFIKLKTQIVESGLREIKRRARRGKWILIQGLTLSYLIF